MNLSALKELMVLQFVRDHPAHGYALSEALEASLGWTLGLTRPTVYTVLQRLEKRGWLDCKDDREGRYPERQVYSMTPAGKAGYLELVERTTRSGGPSIQPFAALILHADELSAEDRLEALTGLRKARQALRDQLEDFPTHDGAVGVALTFMSRQLALELETIDELLQAPGE